MGLLVWLILLLAIAWGVADFQLQSRIEREPPPVPVTKRVPVIPTKTNVAPPVEEVPGGNPPTGSVEQAPNSERSAAADMLPAPPAREWTPQ
ncbi:MAG: hypothetical protein NTV11_13330 [Rhodocyclales bacterium]|nr:hypothetical protein [Rhodocyclales bacterium]